MVDSMDSGRAQSPGSIMTNSPKRKHCQLADTNTLSSTIRYQSPLLADDHINPSGCDSPRSRMAQRLESLNIRASPEYLGSPSPRKKAKVDMTSLHNAQMYQHQVVKRTVDATMKVTKLLSPRERSASSTQKADGSSSHLQESHGRRFRSPPPAYMKTVLEAETSCEEGQEASPLTWQMSEITGMNLDIRAGDDGEGLNGIGFRPSPQTANTRRQKRRQQISDWRMREARDARQKRFERRHGCTLHGDAGGGGMQERSVRFAETL